MGREEGEIDQLCLRKCHNVYEYKIIGDLPILHEFWDINLDKKEASRRDVIENGVYIFRGFGMEMTIHRLRLMEDGDGDTGNAVAKGRAYVWLSTPHTKDMVSPCYQEKKDSPCPWCAVY